MTIEQRRFGIGYAPGSLDDMASTNSGLRVAIKKGRERAKRDAAAMETWKAGDFQSRGMEQFDSNRIAKET